MVSLLHFNFAFLTVMFVAVADTLCNWTERSSFAKSCHATERLLYVSTVDGALTAIDEQGLTLWQYQTGEPLFFSSFRYKESDEVPNLILPGLDRGLYHWDGTKLGQLPFTADSLIDNTHLHKGRGTFLSGAKTNEVVGVNLHTGRAVYKCTHRKCHRYDNFLSRIQDMDILKLSLSRVTVREANERTGLEMWNFTIGDMQLALVQEEWKEEEEEDSCTTQDVGWDLCVESLMGVVCATDKSASDRLLWKVQLSSPVVNVWLHVGGKLESMELSSPSYSLSSHSGLRPDPVPSLMMVHYNNHYYLQPLKNWSVALAAKISSQQDYSQHFSLVVDWATKEFEAKEREEGGHVSSYKNSLSLYYDEDIFNEMCTHGPYGKAVYFYVDPLPYSRVEHDTSGNSQNVCNSVPLQSDEPLGFPRRLLPQHWFFSIIKYTVFGLFVLACSKLHRYRTQQRTRHNSTCSSTDGVEDDEGPVLELKLNGPRRSSSKIATDTEATPTSQTSLFPGSSTETIVTLCRTTPIPEPKKLFRFGSEYDVLGHLGKGGFGVVYHVQNKTDGGEYAVKRIKLPPQKAAREKVMREVRVLAQLDHPRIVRYFNSWVEKAPLSWSDKDEWMPVSRKSSFVQAPNSSSLPPSSTGATISTSTSFLLPPHLSPHLPRPSSPLLPRVRISVGHSQPNSSCPSFNNLHHSTVHSELPPALSSDSQSSSFIIEFQDDGQSDSCLQMHVTDPRRPDFDGQTGPCPRPEECRVENSSEGCFKGALNNREDLSSTDDISHSAESGEESRDCVADLGVESPTYLFIQMQLCQKESLRDWLRTNVINRSRSKVMNFFEQILDAVMYVHDKGMIHRDLKPSNIFFSLDGHIKVGDFGLVTSSVYGGLQSSYLTLKGLGEEQGGQHTGNLGSHFYMSPELMSSKKYNKKVDIFSLGVILFELHYPFATNMERAKVLEKIRKSIFPAHFEATLPLEAELVKWLMSSHPGDRPFVTDIYGSEKFKQLRTTGNGGTIPKL